MSMRSLNGSSGVRLSLSVKSLAFLIRPEGRRHDAVGAEHDHQPLLAALLIGEAQAGQVEHERQGRGADAKIAKKFASRA